MLPASTRRRSLLLASAAAFLSVPAAAQTSPQSLPPVTVDAPQQKRTAAARPAQPAIRRAAPQAARRTAPTPQVNTSAPTATGLETPPGGSLTVPGIAQARAIIDRIPGGVALVPDTAFKNGPANTIRDVLGWVPGVITQPKSNIDNRVSIRGSGLSRNFGNRGINVYMDGIPINTADGLFDLFEIDPTAYRYVEVYKGANGLRYGANSLGGAINFVTPTGRDASPFGARVDIGSFGFCAARPAPAAWRACRLVRRRFGTTRGRISRAQQRQYRARQREPRLSLLSGCRDALLREREHVAPALARRVDQERGVDLATDRGSRVRAARPAAQHQLADVSPTRPRCASGQTTLVDFGVFASIATWTIRSISTSTTTVRDYGGFVRATDERMIGGFRNRLIAGVNIHNGTIDYEEYENLTGAVKGRAAVATLWKIAEPFGLCGEQLLHTAGRCSRCRHAVPACGRDGATASSTMRVRSMGHAAR